MLTSWDKITKQAVADKQVAAADAFTTAENQATEQAAQIQNLILQGYDAIVINAASPTALNGAVKEACDAGITVVSFDGIVTEPCAWRIAVDFKAMGASQIDYLAKAMPKGGNLLEIRGLAGVSVDDEIHAGIVDAVAKNPQFKIVGSVNGDWAQDVAQRRRRHSAEPSRSRGRRDAGRRWLRRGTGFRRRQAPDTHHCDGQP